MLPVIGGDICTNLGITSNMFCAGYEQGGADTCQVRGDEAREGEAIFCERDNRLTKIRAKWVPAGTHGAQQIGLKLELEYPQAFAPVGRQWRAVSVRKERHVVSAGHHFVGNRLRW